MIPDHTTFRVPVFREAMARVVTAVFAVEHGLRATCGAIRIDGDLVGACSGGTFVRCLERMRSGTMHEAEASIGNSP